MCQKMLKGLPSGTKKSHALIASILLAVVGTTISPAFAQNGRRDDDNRRSRTTGGPTLRAPSAAPRESAPRSAPRASAPAPQPRMSAPAPRVSAPAPQQRMSSPPQSIYSPPSSPRVMPQQRSENRSRVGGGGAPITRMQPRSGSGDNDAPVVMPRQSAPQQRSVQPSSPTPAPQPRLNTPRSNDVRPSRVGGGGAPITRQITPDRDERPRPIETPRSPETPRSSQPNSPAPQPRLDTSRPDRDRSSRVGGGSPLTRMPQRESGERPRVIETPQTRSPEAGEAPRTEQPRLPSQRTDRSDRVGRGGMPLGQLHMPRPEDRPQTGGPRNDRDDNGGRGDRDWNNRGGRDRDGDWRDRRDRDWNDRDRHDWRDGNRRRGHRDWGHRDHWRRDRHWDNNWWIGFSFGPTLRYSSYRPWYGYGRPLFYDGCSPRYSYWSSSWCAPSYYTYSDPLCISYRPSYSSWWYYRQPLSYSLCYPTYTSTSYVYYDTPLYTDSATYVYGSSIPSYSSATTILDYPNYSAKLPADYRAYSSPSYSSSYTAPTTAAEEPIVIYQATRSAGEMAWSDTATSIVNSLLNATDRGQTAQKFLGKSVAGAWEVTFQSARRTETGMELTTRGMAAAGTGVRPTIIVNLKRVEQGLETGQRLSITGRLSEITVNDPENAGGLLVLDEADVSY